MCNNSHGTKICGKLFFKSRVQKYMKGRFFLTKFQSVRSHSRPHVKRLLSTRNNCIRSSRSKMQRLYTTMPSFPTPHKIGNFYLFPLFLSLSHSNSQYIFFSKAFYFVCELCVERRREKFTFVPVIVLKHIFLLSHSPQQCVSV